MTWVKGQKVWPKLGNYLTNFQSSWHGIVDNFNLFSILLMIMYNFMIDYKSFHLRLNIFLFSILFQIIIDYISFHCGLSLDMILLTP